MKRRHFIKVAATGLTAAGLVELGARTGIRPFKGFNIKKPDSDVKALLGDLPVDAVDRAILRVSDLVCLPWFEKDEAGELKLAAGVDIPPALDCHTHVGWSQGLGADIDMTVRCPVAYFFDHEAPQDLLNVQMHPTEQEARILSRETELTIIKTPARNKTHTAANLLAEMDRFNITHSMLLPVEIPVRSRHLEQTHRAAELDKRLVPLAAIHPWHWSDKKMARLQDMLKGRIQGLKFHPVFQFMAPDAPDAMQLFEWCAESNVVVLTHTGFTGREPAFMRALSEPERFHKPLRTFPKLRMIFAHTGSRARFPEALEVAKQHPEQVWLEFTGQPVPNIKKVLDEYDPQKLFYGSDWPYYPFSVSLARFLVATAGREHLRPAILRDNFVNLMRSDVLA